MKQILLFGAGKSSSALIGYFLDNAMNQNWHLTVVDANLEFVKQKTGDSSFATPLGFDITDEQKRKAAIENAGGTVNTL